LQLGLAVARGVPFHGLPAARGKVCAFLLEDPVDVVHERLRRLTRDLEAMSMLDEGGDAAAAIRENLRVFGRAKGESPLLVLESPKTGRVNVTERYKGLVQAIRKMRPQLIILDTLARVVNVSEGNRAAWSEAIDLLADLGQHAGGECGVLVLAHPNKADPTGYSGTTGIEGAWRARLQVESRDGFITIKAAKSNYGPVKPELFLSVAGGVPRLVQSNTEDDAAREDRAEVIRPGIIRFLTAMRERGQAVKLAWNSKANVGMSLPHWRGRGRKVGHAALAICA
jgi:hypothetical protein